jgi:hypothetical protein
LFCERVSTPPRLSLQTAPPAAIAALAAAAVTFFAVCLGQLLAEPLLRQFKALY